jgi:hypothetical protein
MLVYPKISSMMQLIRLITGLSVRLVFRSLRHNEFHQTQDLLALRAVEKARLHAFELVAQCSAQD